MSKIITPDIINVASIGNGYKKKMDNCPLGFNSTKKGCVQECPHNIYINNICRCKINKDCADGFTCLNNLCMSTDEKCPVKHTNDKDICIQECKDPKSQNGPVCTCTTNNDCQPEQVCDTVLKSCIVKPESLGYSLGISPDIKKQIKLFQDIKNDSTYNLLLFLPLCVILIVYYVLKKYKFPLSGLISEILIVSSVLIINYVRFSTICKSQLVISGTIRKSVIIIGLSSLITILLFILPPSKMFLSSVGQPAIGWFISITISLLYIINNHIEDDIDGQKYDCNYTLGIDTFKDREQPSNIVFFSSLFRIGVRLYKAFLLG
jgi:hypothetical protein